MADEIVLVSLTAQGANLLGYVAAHEEALAAFVGAADCTATLTRNGTVERAVSETGVVYRGVREYEVACNRTEV